MAIASSSSTYSSSYTCACATLWLSALLCVTACGRLGYELHDLDAGPDPTLQGATQVVPRSPVNAAGMRALRMDAGSPPKAAGSPATVPSTTLDGSVPAAASGAACSSDSACASGACVAGSCCESRCDAPPQCYLAIDVKCDTGQCSYLAAASGAACDDGNPCTLEDRCQDGVCTGRAECGDDNACTEDFCGPDRCAHASTCQPDDLTCSYAEHAGHGYWLCPGPVTFDAARAECKRIGAQLATINDEREQTALWELGMRDTWIGYRAQRGDPDAADAGFDWVDGTSDFEAWADDDLDAGTAEPRCAFLSESELGAWQSRACDDAFSGFACEIEAYAVPESGCRYERRGGHGYYSCASERTWLEAAQHCRNVEAYLVELDNAEEHAFVLTLLKPDARYAIGVTDAQREGQFATTRGGPLAFSAWDAQEPSAQNTERNYAVLTASGVWQTVDSAQRSYYLCEQER